MDLGTNLRGFGHKPSWIWAQAGLEGPGFRIFTGVSKGQGSDFSLVFQVFHCLLRFFGLEGAGFRFFTVFFFHGLEGPGFRIFTGVSKGQGSDFSLVFQVFHCLLRFFGLEGAGFRFFTVFFFHGLEGPGFRIFTGVSKGQGSDFSLVFQVFHCLLRFFGLEGAGFRFFTVFFFTGSRGQGSGFSQPSGPQGSGFQARGAIFQQAR